MAFKPERSKRVIKIADPALAKEAGDWAAKTFKKTFKKLADSEHSEIKCANCIHMTDQINRKILSKLPKSERENCKWVCLANDMKTEPHSCRCGGDDFQNKYTK